MKIYCHFAIVSAAVVENLEHQDPCNFGGIKRQSPLDSISGFHDCSPASPPCHVWKSGPNRCHWSTWRHICCQKDMVFIYFRHQHIALMRLREHNEKNCLLLVPVVKQSNAQCRCGCFCDILPLIDCDKIWHTNWWWWLRGVSERWAHVRLHGCVRKWIPRIINLMSIFQVCITQAYTALNRYLNINCNSRPTDFALKESNYSFVKEAIPSRQKWHCTSSMSLIADFVSVCVYIDESVVTCGRPFYWGIGSESST